MPAQLLAVADEAENASPDSDCRVYERKACELPSACQPASAMGSAESKWSATICDISQGGIRLKLRRRFERGTGLAIELPACAGREAYTVLAKVVHILGESDGSWSLGCRFISELNDDEVERLLQTPSATNADNSNIIANVHCRLELRPQAVVNYLIKGLFMAEAWPLPEGKTITLRCGGDEPWSHKVEVIECSKLEAGWLLHCKLAPRPTVAHLLHVLS